MEHGKTVKDAIRENYPTVSVDDTLEQALKNMAGDNATGLLVKQDGNMIGIITITDIMYSLAREEDPGEVKVGSFMTKCEVITDKTVKSPCVQLDEDKDLLSAIKVMNEAGVNHVLVSGSNGEPLGMVSSLEVIRLLVA